MAPRANFDYLSTFVPMPDLSRIIAPVREKSSGETGTKMKVYYPNRPYIIMSIRSEIASLYQQGYTHVVNMPGNFDEIKCVCKFYGIVCMGNKNIKYVADWCSGNMIDRNFSPLKCEELESQSPHKEKLP